MATIPGVPHPDELREQLNTAAGWLERYKDWVLGDPQRLQSTLTALGFRQGGALDGAAAAAERLNTYFKRVSDATEALYFASQSLHTVLADTKREHERRAR